MDGGVEGGALEQPYADDPGNSGHLNWDPAVMTRVCAEAVRRGWRIGTHASGDRAVRTVLDVYEAVAAERARCRRGPWSSSTRCCLMRRSEPAPCGAASP